MITPKMSGKFTACPKLAKLAGVAGNWTSPG